MNLLSAAHMCSDSLCNVISIEYVPVDLIVNALRHFLNSLFGLVVEKYCTFPLRLSPYWSIAVSSLQAYLRGK